MIILFVSICMEIPVVCVCVCDRSVGLWRAGQSCGVFWSQVCYWSIRVRKVISGWGRCSWAHANSSRGLQRKMASALNCSIRWSSPYGPSRYSLLTRTHTQSTHTRHTHTICNTTLAIYLDGMLTFTVNATVFTSNEAGLCIYISCMSKLQSMGQISHSVPVLTVQHCSNWYGPLGGVHALS